MALTSGSHRTGAKVPIADSVLRGRRRSVSEVHGSVRAVQQYGDRFAVSCKPTSSCRARSSTSRSAPGVIPTGS